MAEKAQTTRRDLLARTAKIAAAAGLVSATGCSTTSGPAISVVAGPSPKPIEPDQVIGVGLVGVGGRGSNLYDAVCKQEGVTVKAIADPNEKNWRKARHLLKKRRGWEPEIYTGEQDYRKLMAREDINAVVLATPCYLHAKMYLACFEHGRHFYGEKPMCIEINEVKPLVEAQKKNPQVVGQIGFQRRAGGIYYEGIQKIHEGVIGPIFGGMGAWNNDWGPLGGKARPDKPFWFGRRKFSGDWMLEQACHTWDVFNWVMGGLPVAASGVGRHNVFTDVDPERDVTDYYYAHLEYPNEVIIDFEHCWCCPQGHLDKKGRYNGVFERFIGPKGGIDLSEGAYTPRGPDRKPFDIPGEKRNLPMTEKAIETFFKTVRTGGKSVADMEVGRRASLVGIMVRKAVYEKRRVKMSELV